MGKTKIITAVDLVNKSSDRHVILEAISLAKTHNSDVEVLFVIPDQQAGFLQNYIPADMRKKVQQEAEEELADYTQEFDWGEVKYSTLVLRGVVYEKIIEHSEAVKSNFIVIGSNRPSVKDLFIGPNAARVARHASCSVLIVRPD